MSHRILIVDDDNRHSHLLAKYFESEGFETVLAQGAIEMQKQRDYFQCDLMVLDVNMPGEDGLSICRRLRAEGDNIPIILLTARNETVDRILGLEYGSDDYLAKPFDPRELLARVRAVLRRIDKEIPATHKLGLLRVQFGPYVLDASSRSLLCKGKTVSLSADELALLMLLVSMPGKTLSRNQLAWQIKGVDQKIDQRNIDMLVSRLRKRLEEDPLQPRYIKTVRGIGYIFTGIVEFDS
jgi:two-component system phosphate regulon response regulator OmpR